MLNAAYLALQLALLQPLVGVDAGQRHLGRAGQVQVVAFQVVQVGFLGRQETGAVHGPLADQHRRQHGEEPLAGQPVQHEPVQRLLGDGHVADPVGEPGSGQPGTPGHVDPAAGRAQVGGVLDREAERRPLAPGADGDRVLLGHAVRGGRVGQVRDPGQQRLPDLLGLGLLGLGRVQFLTQLAQLGDLLRAGRRALGGALLGRAELLGPLGQLAPPLVGGEQGVEVIGRVTPGQCGAVPVRFLARGFEVNHLRESSGHSQYRRPARPRPAGARRRPRPRTNLSPTAAQAAQGPHD